MDMNPEARSGGIIESAHGDADPVALNRIPEQGRTTGRTEPALHLLRRLIPGDILGACDGHGGARRVCRNEIMAGRFAALPAMAGVGRMQLAADSEPHGAAQA
jgi:hypothetical protein